MGASCVIQICEHYEPEVPVARIYLHWGGETFEDVANTLRTFALVNEGSPDPRWTDAPYLAARLLVWAASDSRILGAHDLDFLSVGIVNSDEWGDYLGRIVTPERGSDDWPRPSLLAGPVGAGEDDWREVQIHWSGDPAAAS